MVKKNSEYIIHPPECTMYLKLFHNTHCAAITSGTVSRTSSCYEVSNSSHVTLGQDLIYEEGNIDRGPPLFNVVEFLRKLLHFLIK